MVKIGLLSMKDRVIGREKGELGLKDRAVGQEKKGIIGDRAMGRVFEDIKKFRPSCFKRTEDLNR